MGTRFVSEYRDLREPDGGTGGGAAVTTVTTTTASIAAGANATANLTDWFDNGLVTKMTVTAASAAIRATIEVFQKDTFLAADLAYQAINVDAYTAAYVDRIPWAYQDADTSKELHVKITNNGTVTSTFTITVVGIGE